MPPVALTFGCRLNAAETRVMFSRAEEAGLEDAILVNTCAVTAEAVRQARQAIRKARREHPGRTIVVSGCAAQVDPETFARMPEVDLVLGNAEKLTAEAYRIGGDTTRDISSAGPTFDVVIAGLDPAIHSGTVESRAEANGMDARIKSGHDDNGRRPAPNTHAEVTHPAPLDLSSSDAQHARSEDPGDTDRAVLGPRLSPRGDARGSAEDDAAEGGGSLSLSAFAEVRVSDIFAVTENAPHLAGGFPASTHLGQGEADADSGYRTRAFLEVQNGCDHRCTFCIIPYGRGNARSVPMGAVVDAARRLVDEGVSEIVLTGVDLTSYGGDLPGSPRLGRLVRAILRHVPELPRLRISSIDSVEADPELVAAIAEEERLMPHLHLSLQSGDDMILKRMKRRHSRADAIRFCADIRARRPDIVLGADLIAGFPTETDAMFENTLSLIEACGLTLLHVFPFSPRGGTPAARMPQVPRHLAQERAKTARHAGDRAYLRRLRSETGALRRILVEKPGFGRTEHYLPAVIHHGEPGEIVSARIAGTGDNQLTAQAIQEPA